MRVTHSDMSHGGTPNKTKICPGYVMVEITQFAALRRKKKIKTRKKPQANKQTKKKT